MLKISFGQCVKLLYLLDNGDQGTLDYKLEYKEAAAECKQAFLSSLVDGNTNPVIDLLKLRLRNSRYLPTFCDACKFLRIEYSQENFLCQGDATRINAVKKTVISLCDSWSFDKVKRFLVQLRNDPSISTHFSQITSLPQETRAKELLFFCIMRILEEHNRVYMAIEFALS